MNTFIINMRMHGKTALLPFQIGTKSYKKISNITNI